MNEEKSTYKWTENDSVYLQSELEKLKKNAEELKKNTETALEKTGEEFDFREYQINESIEYVTKFAKYIEENSYMDDDVHSVMSNSHKKMIMENAKRFGE